MFTGIIGDVGTIVATEKRAGADLSLAIRTAFPLATMALGASVACGGACLTIVAKDSDYFTVELSAETLAKTAPRWEKGARINLERALKVGDELGGHIVTGHVDGVGAVAATAHVDGSTALAIRVPQALAPLVAAKGSVAIDGVSLTINRVEDAADAATGALVHLNIIPHTARHTTLGALRPGDPVNIEIDVLARYLQRLQQARAV